MLLCFTVFVAIGYFAFVTNLIIRDYKRLMREMKYARELRTYLIMKNTLDLCEEHGFPVLSNEVIVRTLAKVKTMSEQ